MRHVRMLGLCLLAAFAVSAMVAVPALAKKKEIPWNVFEHCRYNAPSTEVDLCFAGITSGGPKGGFFQLGAAKVALSKPVILQGGLWEDPENEDEYIVPATNGGETLESPALKVTGGLGLITRRIQEYRKWPAALIDSLKEAKTNKEASLAVKIEVAGGNQLYEIPNALNVTNLIFETGPAFTLPLKVTLISPWLAKLGGTCTVGNEANPIFQYLTTEPSSNGSAGALEIGDSGNYVKLEGSRLGDLGWPVPQEARVSGCGGEYETYIDSAINEVLGIEAFGRENPAEWAHGLTLLQGNLYEATREAVQGHFEP